MTLEKLPQVISRALPNPGVNGDALDGGEERIERGLFSGTSPVPEFGDGDGRAQ